MNNPFNNPAFIVVSEKIKARMITIIVDVFKKRNKNILEQEQIDELSNEFANILVTASVAAVLGESSRDMPELADKLNDEVDSFVQLILSAVKEGANYNE